MSAFIRMSNGRYSALFHEQPAIRANSATWPILFRDIGQRQDLERMAASVFDAVAQGVLAVEPGKVIPLTAAATVHAELEGRQASGPLLRAP